MWEICHRCLCVCVVNDSDECGVRVSCIQKHLNPVLDPLRQHDQVVCWLKRMSTINTTNLIC